MMIPPEFRQFWRQRWSTQLSYQRPAHIIHALRRLNTKLEVPIAEQLGRIHRTVNLMVLMIVE